MRIDGTSLCDLVNARHMRELLLDFASIPSPADDTAIAAEWYAGYLRASGAAEVRILRDQPRAPTVIAGFPGLHRGPMLEIHGHLGTCLGAHRRAQWTGAAIVGSGLIAGKAELIAAAEAARVLSAAGPLPGGGLLVVATSGREPVEREDPSITGCIDRGMVGDAVLIAGGDHRIAPVAGLGLGIFRAGFAPLHVPAHERRGAANAYRDGPGARAGGFTAIDAAQAFVSLLRRRRVQFARDASHETESLFVSGVWGGDGYDREPAACEVEGNWRWLPERTSADVFPDLETLARQAADRRGARANLTFTPLRDGYRIDPGAPIVSALRRAYHEVVGEPLPLGTGASSSYAELFLRRGGVTAVAHGVDTATFRGDPEEVALDEVVRVARTYLRTALRYLTDSGPAPAAPARQSLYHAGSATPSLADREAAPAEAARLPNPAFGVEGTQ